MVRVLHVIGAMDRAGAETFLMNLYRSIDHRSIQFDFLVHTEKLCDYDAEIESLGGRIFRVPRYNILNKKAYSDAVRAILRDHPEDAIVHSHIGSSAPIHLKVAQEEGRYTIAHSHAQTRIDTPSDLVFRFVARPVRGRAEQYLACSPEAAKDRFGNAIARSAQCAIVKNGIGVDGYKRDEETTKAAKIELDVQGRPVFGHIGRFVHDKNHAFLLDVFDEIRKQLPDAVLLLSGRGPLEKDIRQAVVKRNLIDSVVFLGMRDDIPNTLRAMDVFLFPSHHEGLGIAFIEAQAAGLECIASTGIPQSAVCTARAQRVPLGLPRKWAQMAIDAYARSLDQLDDRVAEVRNAGFDIASVAKEMTALYESAINLGGQAPAVHD